MSVNTRISDVMASRLTSNNSPINNHMPNGIEYSFSGSREWNPQDGRMSPARRTFCLFTLFDLILTFILWVIYTQLIGEKPIWSAFEKQVYKYSFKTSLFDSVMVSTARFTFIMLAYALFRISHWWVIAISTSMTCIYLLAKCFLFEFSDSVFGGNNPLSYILLVVCFVMAWIETWMLDFKVLPREKQMRNAGRTSTREREPLLSDGVTNSYRSTDVEYYSPYHTPEESEDESESTTSRDRNRRQASHGSFASLQSSGEYDTYAKLLEEAKEAFLELFKSEEWKKEAGKSMEEGLISSQYVKKYGRKLFRLQGIMNMPAKDLWEDMIQTLNDSPKWNPTILESRTLQVLDQNSEITYNIAAEGGGGLVSARDFVTLRKWMPLGNGIYISVSVGLPGPHPDMPPQKKYVRGDNGPGGWAFEPVPDDPNKCIYTWIVNSNLKGWLPQAAIDQAMSGVLRDYFRLLTQHYEDVMQQRAESV